MSLEGPVALLLTLAVLLAIVLSFRRDPRIVPALGRWWRAVRGAPPVDGVDLESLELAAGEGLLSGIVLGLFPAFFALYLLLG